MKKRKAVLAGLVAAMLLTACTVGKTPVSGGTDEPTGPKAPDYEMDEGQKEQGASDAKTEEKEDVGRTLNIYYSNEMADGLEMTSMLADQVTPELLLSGLAKYNIVTRDTKVRFLEVRKEGEEQIVFLDLSREFGDYVSTMGTSGEYVIMGALTNTFLDAYEADALSLTVEGDYLETGHAIYDWDLTRCPMLSYTVESKVYEKNKVRIEYPQLVNAKDIYMEEEWNEIFENYALKDLEYLDEEAEYNLRYEVATATEELLSIVYRVGSYEPGAAHPYAYIQTFNIDLNSGKEVRLADFIDPQKVADCLASEKGYELINTDLKQMSFREFLRTTPDMLTAEYFEEFDLDSTKPDQYPAGYSYKKDGFIVVCMEVNHALGDFLELKLL